MKKRMIDFRVFIPNILTLIAICAGLSAIRFAFEGNYQLALISMLVAAMLDGLDGRIARALKATSQFGAELDSLADVINFGVVPALILYIWDLNNFGNFGWMACLLYTIAIALRLARFNVADFKSAHLFVPPDEIENKSTIEAPKTFFIGVPAPMAAILVLLPIYFSLSGLNIPFFASLEAFYVLIISGFTISTLKTPSLKGFRFNAKNSLTVLFVIALIAVLLFSFTWIGLIILCLVYLCFLFYMALRLMLRFYGRRLIRLRNNDIVN